MSQSLPDNDPLVDDNKHAFRTWMQWLGWAHASLIAVRQSGPTSGRPTSLLWIGRQYFDTTLNKPVYVSAANPPVWRDASGSVV